MPWSVNAFAIETGLFLLRNDISRSTDISVLLERARLLGESIASLGGGGFFEVGETHTHYMLVKIIGELNCREEKSASAAVLKEHLARKWGILIRDASNFATLGQGHFRIATQTGEQNTMLVKALEELCM